MIAHLLCRQVWEWLVPQQVDALVKMNQNMLPRGVLFRGEFVAGNRFLLAEGAPGFELLHNLGEGCRYRRRLRIRASTSRPTTTTTTECGGTRSARCGISTTTIGACTATATTAIACTATATTAIAYCTATATTSSDPGRGARRRAGRGTQQPPRHQPPPRHGPLPSARLLYHDLHVKYAPPSL